MKWKRFQVYALAAERCPYRGNRVSMSFRVPRVRGQAALRPEDTRRKTQHT